jgi:hypothetical protein
MSKNIEDIMNDFLLSIVNDSNVTLVKELRYRFKEYLNTPVISAPKEEQPTEVDTFQWTDELVTQFANSVDVIVLAGGKEIENFKQSK